MEKGEKKIYKQGADAYMAGKSINDNPYPSDSVFGKWWNKAFIQEARYWRENFNHDAPNQRS